MNRAQNRILPLFLSILAALYSWFVSGGGIQPLLPDMVIYMSWIIALGISLIISVAIFAFWRAVILRQAVGRFEHYVFVFCGIVSSSLSAAVASGFASYALNDRHYQQQAVAGPLAQMLEPVNQVADAASKNSVHLKLLAERMDALKEREQNVGDTCAGVIPQAACGPRCRMRKKIGEKANEHAVAAARVARAARELASRAVAVTSSIEWSELYGDVLDIASDTSIYAIALWADQLATNFSTGFREGDQVFFCRDTKTSTELRLISSALKAEVNLPEAPPAWTEADGSFAVRQNLQTLRDGIFYYVGLTPSFDRTAMATMAMPLSFSILVEVFTVACLALAFPAARREKARVHEEPPKDKVKDPRKYWIKLKELVTSERQRDELTRLSKTYSKAALIQKLAQPGKVRFATYLLVPLSGQISEAKRNEINWCVNRLELGMGDLRWASNSVDKDADDQLRQVFLERWPEGVDEYAVYRVPEKVDKYMRKIIAAVGSE
ncbi:MAG: hypothetical protein AAF756_15615 [Pseudomonadota bacterium]